MATNKTQNLKLNSWVGTDGVKREEINENFTKIDTKLGSVDAQLTGMASKSELAAVSGQIADKASKSEVTAVSAQLAETVKFPKNYNLAEPRLVEDFSGEFGANWNTQGKWWVSNGVMTVDTLNVKHGSQSIKVTTSGIASIRKDFPSNPITNLADSMQEIGFWVYVKNYLKVSEIAVTMESSSGVSFTGRFKLNINGWNFIKMNSSTFSVNGAPTWRRIVSMVFTVYGVAATTENAEVTFDSFFVGYKGISNVLFTFDDATTDNYTEAYQYMKSKGLKGTIYAVKNWTDTAGYMTTAQLKEVNDGGWTVGNHTVSHPTLPNGTSEMALNEIQGNAIWLESIGCIKGAKHVAYPYGKTSIMIDEVMESVGIKTGRLYSQYGLQTTPFTQKYRLITKDVLMQTTVEEVLAEIDKAKKIGATCILVFHKILDSPTLDYDWSITNFRSLVDKVKQRNDRCLTIDEWYDGLSKPSYHFA